jgi:hypothetical protein
MKDTGEKETKGQGKEKAMSFVYEVAEIPTSMKRRFDYLGRKRLG